MWGARSTRGSLDRTCSRTLAVSRGKVQRSAMQAAVPALMNFTVAVGGTSGGFRPTIVAEGLEGKGAVCGGGCAGVLSRHLVWGRW